MANWVTYKNGNYTVYFNKDDGTKIRDTDADHFEAAFPESFDLKICNKCNMNCPQCHENSTPDGLCGDILSAEFINSLHPHTEIAIGGGNPLEHPDLEAFLYKLKIKEIIPSMTVHQVHFLENLEYLRMLRDEKLIYGLGVSITNVTPELIEALKEFPNAVCHIIAGIVTEDQLHKLAHHNLKILILGYKMFRRGETNYEKHSSQIDFLIQYLYDLLPVMHKEGWFDVISFDNLALDQLNAKRLVSEQEWEETYMGDDGQFTMYIDLVKNEFARSSTSVRRYSLKSTVEEMLQVIREEQYEHMQ